MNTKEEIPEFEFPSEITDARLWEYKQLNQIRGFIIGKTIEIERTIDQIIIFVLYDDPSQRKKYFEKKLESMSFSSKIDQLCIILQAKRETKELDEAKAWLDSIKKVRNRVAHDNWKEISEGGEDTEGFIRMEHTTITSVYLKKFMEHIGKADKWLRPLYTQYVLQS